GLTSRGCDLEIKPAHPGCSFRKVSKHITQSEMDAYKQVTVSFDDIRSESADRDCSFAITIREPGQPPQTLHRGLRLSAPGSPATQSLSCCLSSPSRVARIAAPDATTTKR